MDEVGQKLDSHMGCAHMNSHVALASPSAAVQERQQVLHCYYLNDRVLVVPDGRGVPSDELPAGKITIEKLLNACFVFGFDRF